MHAVHALPSTADMLDYGILEWLGGGCFHSRIKIYWSNCVVDRTGCLGKCATSANDYINYVAVIGCNVNPNRWDKYILTSIIPSISTRNIFIRPSPCRVMNICPPWIRRKCFCRQPISLNCIAVIPNPNHFFSETIQICEWVRAKKRKKKWIALCICDLSVIKCSHRQMDGTGENVRLRAGKGAECMQ